MNKLSARCQGKTKYFAQAVKEISAAFQELQKEKSSGIRGTDRAARGCDAASVDGIEDEMVLESNNDLGTSGTKRETGDEEGDFGSKLKHCSHRLSQTEYDLRPSVSADVNDNSFISLEEKVKISNGEQMQVVLSTSCLDDPSHAKDGESGDVHEDVTCAKSPGIAERAWANGHKSKSMAMETKRKPEVAIKGHKNNSPGSCVTFLPDNGKEEKDGMKEKNASGGTISGFSPDAIKPVSEDVKSDFEIRQKKANEHEKGKKVLWCLIVCRKIY